MSTSVFKPTIRSLAIGTSIALGIALFAPVFLGNASAQAATGTTSTYQANLTQLNKSGASGTATITTTDHDVTVTIRSTGLSPNRAHAAHIYVGGQASCPAATADTNKDGYVDNNEAKPSRGDLKVSLTTGGDTSSNSALAFNRMPVADKDGKIAYSRTFALPSGITVNDLSKATIGLQGISTIFNSKVIYDGDKRSELTNDHAFETTIPAACGTLTATPNGGAATGVGSVSGIESPALFAFGAIALAGALIAGLLARKQFANHRR
jgi:hypothetical protein